MPVIARFYGIVIKMYFSKILELGRFQLLKQEALFKAVRVDPGGYGISWDDEMDLSEYELWNNGVHLSQIPRQIAAS